MSDTGAISNIIDQTHISHRAMQFYLHRGGTQRRVRDRDAEVLVKQQLGDEGQIVSRELFKDKSSPVYKYQSLANEMYAYHVKATLPFGDDSSRLLPNAAYFDYTTKMGGFISSLDQLKGAILFDWNNLVTQDVYLRNQSLIAQNKNPVAGSADYPTTAQMDAKLYVNWYPKPIASSDDPRWAVPQEMKDRLDAQYGELVKEAARDLYGRMLTPVSKFIEKLSVYTGDKGQKFHGSFIDNLNNLTKEITPLDVTNDPMVQTFLQQIDQIIKPYAFQTEVLKENADARADVKAKLQVLEASLKGYAL